MTGKELKAFASQVSDEAVVEIQDGSSYSKEWKPLTDKNVRAIVVPAPIAGEKEEGT